MSGLAARWARLLAGWWAGRWAGRLHDPLLLPAALVVAVAAAGYVGYRDWQGHRPVEAAGRSAQLCRQPTGADTPLGRLLPAGRQDSEERIRSGVRATDQQTCTVRIDGRTVLTVTSVLRTGDIALTSADAKRPDARPFDVPGLSAAWPGGAAAAQYCLTGPSGYVEVQVTAGEAARTDGADGLDALEQVDRAALAALTKEFCR
ncbi:hypothetical protein [Streptomyces sp. CBMA156]|uniref:hypothetical protein n=1 Tax=Streptomyces sp. CBMA156 TaxID=1930280 RepID=UPI001661FB8B|nr:hypothetical protein [Streptomyces sp. CBMA156]MBD0674089.1 hypothetical protein [Streptomyces sp. CBMA156]